MKIKTIAIVLTLIAISGCTTQTTTTTTTTIPPTSLQTFPAEAEKSCANDFDCACGVHVETGKCFYGNKNFVNVMKQCPDFCTGIANNLMIKCVDSECRQVPR